MWVGAVGSDAGEREGQRGKERPQEKKKRKRMTKLPRPLKFPVARSQMHPLGEKMKTENAPKLSTHRENTKDNFSILVFLLVGLVFFLGRVGRRPQIRLTHNQLCPA